MEVRISVKAVGKPFSHEIAPYSFRNASEEGTKTVKRQVPIKISLLDSERTGKET